LSNSIPAKWKPKTGQAGFFFIFSRRQLNPASALASLPTGLPAAGMAGFAELVNSVPRRSLRG